MNRFENFPELARRMEMLANTKSEMSLSEWGDFCATVDAALAESFDIGFRAAGGQVTPIAQIPVTCEPS